MRYTLKDFIEDSEERAKRFLYMVGRRGPTYTLEELPDILLYNDIIVDYRIDTVYIE